MATPRGDTKCNDVTARHEAKQDDEIGKMLKDEGTEASTADRRQR